MAYVAKFDLADSYDLDADYDFGFNKGEVYCIHEVYSTSSKYFIGL